MSGDPLRAVTVADAVAAQARIAGIARTTPLVSLDVADANGAAVWLKLENLQPIGSFKIRGAANAMAQATLTASEWAAHGVYTASAGNMAQGVAWCARVRGIPCTVVVPDHAPRAKTDAIERLGGHVVRVPFAEWWETLMRGHFPGQRGVFVHPFADNAVMAGNATIALEIVDALPDVDVVLVPYGGGGLACGVAGVLRALRPSVAVYAVEVETAAPLTPSLAAGAPVAVPYTRTFIDGMGSGAVADVMWPLASTLLAGTIVVTVAQTADAVRLLATRARTVAEGAGAAPVAAALSGDSRLAGKRIACVVSGGNIDAHRLSAILAGMVPD